MPTATTYLKSHKRADKRTALQSLKDRFDYGLNPEKLGAVSSYPVSYTHLTLPTTPYV